MDQTSRSRSLGKKSMVPCIVTRNTNVQYESHSSSGLKIMAKVKLFVHTSHMDTEAMTLAPRAYLKWLAKMKAKINKIERRSYKVLTPCSVLVKLTVKILLTTDNGEHNNHNSLTSAAMKSKWTCLKLKSRSQGHLGSFWNWFTYILCMINMKFLHVCLTV